MLMSTDIRLVLHSSLLSNIFLLFFSKSNLLFIIFKIKYFYSAKGMKIKGIYSDTWECNIVVCIPINIYKVLRLKHRIGFNRYVKCYSFTQSG
jgi:hypothetical protein